MGDHGDYSFVLFHCSISWTQQAGTGKHRQLQAASVHTRGFKSSRAASLITALLAVSGADAERIGCLLIIARIDTVHLPLGPIMLVHLEAEQ